MLNSLFRDSVINASAAIIAASLPLMTMGMIGHPALLISAGSVGCAFIFVFLIRCVVVMRNGGERVRVLDSIMKDMLFPYCFALSFAIGIAFGEKAGWFGIWFALGLAVIIVISNLIADKTGNLDN